MKPQPVIEDQTGPDETGAHAFPVETPAISRRKGPLAQPVILVVEDEPDILDLITFHLEKAGNVVRKATDGAHGLRMCQKKTPDLVVLDLMLPGMDGKEVLRRIRQDQTIRSTPVLILTAKADEVDRIVGFEIGADDYMTKPFSPRELVLRIEAVLKRVRPTRPAAKLIRSGALLIDPERHRVEIDGKELALTITEFRLVHYLATHAGRVQSRDILLDQVWGYSYEGYSRTVDTHVRRVRKKLGTLRDCIETVRGVGYRYREAK
jgi:two-component system phosphate regulon response regulator PhoB